MCERRKLLEENIKEVKNHIMISEQSLIKVRCLICCLLFVACLFVVYCYCCCCLQREGDLSDLIMKVIRQGLEGLVLKDLKVSRFQFQLRRTLPSLNYKIL